MKAIAINGSPHMEEGNTAMILNPFLEGLKEEGYDVELFYTSKLKIGPCNGDMSCWFKNPGICSQKDDMQMLAPKMKEADILVWASPLYYSGVTGPLKNLMDRQLPINVPGIQKAKNQKIILVSTCADWDISAFDPLIMQMNAIYNGPDGSSTFVGSLLRPMAEGLKEMVKAGETGLVEGVFQAARQAGRQLAREGIISEELQKQVSRALMPRDAYYKAAQMMMEEIRKASGN